MIRALQPDAAALIDKARLHGRVGFAVADLLSGAWWIAGIAMFGLIVVVGWSMVRPGPPPTPGGGPAAPAGAPAAGQAPVDLSSMSPLDAANRLFNRVMTTLEAGDTAGALGFQPMAVQAYEMIEPLDLAQVGRPLAEYQGHQPSLTQMQSAARAFLDQR